MSEKSEEPHFSCSNAIQCFRPKKKQKPSKKSRNQFSKVEITWTTKNHTLYTRMLEEINEEVEIIQKSIYQDLILKLTKFVEQNSSNNENDYYRNLFSGRLIQTAVITLGANVSDHKIVTRFLKNQLDHIPFLVSINSVDHNSVNSIVNAISKVVIPGDFEMRANKIFPFCLILKFYESLIAQNNIKERRPPLIIIFEDFANFAMLVLKNFIILAKEYVNKIPMIFLFTLSTIDKKLQDLLPASAIDYLVVENFTLDDSEKEHGDKIFFELVINPSLPLKIGSKVLRLLTNNFYYYDGSIQNIKKILQHSIFEHYYSNSSTFLCRPSYELKDAINKLTVSELELIKTLPSLRKVDLPEKEEKFKIQIFNLAKEILDYHKHFITQLQVLYRFGEQFPENNPFGKNFRDFYLLAMDSTNLAESSQVKNFKRNLRHWSLEEWKDFLTESIENTVADENTSYLLDILEEYRVQMNHLTKMDLKNPKAMESNVEFGNFRLRSEFRERMRKNAMTSKIPSKFDLVKQEAIESFQKFFNKLKSPLTLPLNEIFYFDDLETIKAQHFPVFRRDIQLALHNPLALKIENLPRTLSTTDLCLLFKLYSEAQLSINLRDWLDAFVEIKKANMPSKKRKRVSDNQKNSVIAFLNAVSDLEYLGLVQASKRKTDQLTRLVWF